MSYILDALRKSDQQRRHGAVPTLASAPRLPDNARRAPLPRVAIGVSAAAVLGIGVAIGWLHPGPDDSRTVPPTTAAATAPLANATPAPTTVPAVVPAFEHPSARTDPRPPDSPPPAPKAESAPRVPAARELPAVTITVHAWAADPAERLAGVNGKLLREGQEAAPGLRLERITPDGLILNYQGRRFRRSVQ